MKTDIHPEYVQAHVRCTCGNEFETRSTQVRDPRRDLLELPSRSTPVVRSSSTPADASTASSGAPPSGRPAAEAAPSVAAAHESERLPDGSLVARSGRPRGRPGGARGRDDARRLDVGGGRPRPERRAAPRRPAPGRRRGGRRRDRGPELPARLGAQAPPLAALPIVRGVVALGESLKIGFKALNISANAQLPADEEAISGNTWARRRRRSRWRCAIGLFFVLPVGLTSLFKDALPNSRRSSSSSRSSSGSRSSSSTSGRSRGCATCSASSSTTAPSTRRSPATRRASSSRPRTRSASAACTRAAGRASC